MFDFKVDQVGKQADRALRAEKDKKRDEDLKKAEMSTSTMREAIKKSEHRRIWADVEQDVARRFFARCRDEKINPDAAFAALVESYADGARLVFPKAKKKRTGVDYVEKHGLASRDENDAQDDDDREAKTPLS